MARPSLKSTVDQYKDNPNVRAFLNVIAGTEGVTGLGDNGYNAIVGGKTFEDYSQHPNAKQTLKRKNASDIVSTAAGRYQFINRTWQDIQKKLDLPDFSPASQDAAAVALIAQRGALEDVVNGDTAAAVKKLGKEWASLPTSPYDQSKVSYDKLNNLLAQNGLPTIGSDGQTGGQSFNGFALNDNGIQSVSVTNTDDFLQIGNTGIGVQPQTPEDVALVQEINDPAIDDQLKVATLQLLGQVTAAEQAYAQPNTNQNLLGGYPTALDSRLMALVRQTPMMEQ